VINEHTFRLNYTNEGGLWRQDSIVKNIMGLWDFARKQTPMGIGNRSHSIRTRLDKWAEEAKLSWHLSIRTTVYSTNPGDMPSRIREYCKNTGQKIPETRGQITRCILESLAMKYRYAITALEKIRGVTFEGASCGGRRKQKRFALTLYRIRHRKTGNRRTG
jgi:rhamnulokinase